MKNFDIENLERKNIYKIPDTLFDNVQENVMNAISTDTEETVISASKGKIVKLNWWMAAAASLVLIFGLGWIFSDSFTNQNNINTIDTLVKTELPHNAVESTQAYNIVKSDLSSIDVDDSKKNINTTNVKTIASSEEIKKTNIKTVNLPNKEVNEEEMNVYLDVLSNKEISDIAQNSVSDVYLDLYN